MKDLVEVIAKSLVDNPSEVHVNEIQGEQDLILELRVAPEDMGKVIGKQGRIAKAIRTVVKAVALNKDQKIVVEIIDVKS
ncbi:KH domain-containing protein [uncultured Clostridium sp.]|uniref:KH domain-containing protein n=1 Tax=uncultured Clostridium sp. TaxID=59620 RepID=UPI0025ED37D4|nr:KH domain-containing protein [uncultured Clostridium sp.]